MKKRLPDKGRALVTSNVRRTAMMGAAATALFAASTVLQAAEPVGQSTALQAAIKNILKAPDGPAAWHESLGAPPGSSPRPARSTSATGTTSPSVPDQTALSQAESEEDISLVNTGDLTGGIGIEVSTGANDLCELGVR